MSLLDVAEADGRTILADLNGFGHALTLVNPAGQEAALRGATRDISLTIDPNTGVPVAGRQASVVLSLTVVVAAGLGMPRVIAETSGRPWLVRWTNPTGEPRVFKVADVSPDESRGADVVALMLEAYSP